MKFEIIEKLIPTKFVVINNVEFNLVNLIGCLRQILYDTKINDPYGDYSLRGYEIYDYDAMEKLVEMGLVKNYRGSRMANLYCMKDKNAIEKLIDTLDELSISK